MFSSFSFFFYRFVPLVVDYRPFPTDPRNAWAVLTISPDVNPAASNASARALLWIGCVWYSKNRAAIFLATSSRRLRFLISVGRLVFPKVGVAPSGASSTTDGATAPPLLPPCVLKPQIFSSFLGEGEGDGALRFALRSALRSVLPSAFGMRF